jgi:hypothetical protein
VTGEDDFHERGLVRGVAGALGEEVQAVAVDAEGGGLRFRETRRRRGQWVRSRTMYDARDMRVRGSWDMYV